MLHYHHWYSLLDIAAIVATVGFSVAIQPSVDGIVPIADRYLVVESYFPSYFGFVDSLQRTYNFIQKFNVNLLKRCHQVQTQFKMNS